MNYDIPHETLVRLVQTFAIAAVALMFFFGLKNRLLSFARWANLPTLTFTPVSLTIRYGVLISALLLILACWGFQIGTLAAVMGSILGLIGVGFIAVWSVLSNLLCTFVLIAFKPFSVGDEIEIPIDNVKGKVVDLSLVFTTLRVNEGETVLIPNNIFFQRIFRRRPGTVTVDLDYQLRQNEAHPASGD